MPPAQHRQSRARSRRVRLLGSGGRACRAAFVARELGIPCVVGTSRETRTLTDGEELTISCAEGDDGKVYPGIVPFDREEIDPATLPTPAEIRDRLGGDRPAYEFFSSRLAMGVAQIAAAFYPRPVIVRFSDFKTNEYAGLLGGSSFEPVESNPTTDATGTPLHSSARRSRRCGRRWASPTSR
jgi:pyruvate, water dikinase